MAVYNTMQGGFIMDIIEKLLKRRDEILEKINSIKRIKRGTINEQYLKVPRKNGEAALKGPYYVLSKSVNGKTKSQRIKRNELEIIKKDIDAYHEFLGLSNEFVEVTEEITDIIRASDDIDLKKTKNS